MTWAPNPTPEQQASRERFWRAWEALRLSAAKPAKEEAAT